MIDGCVSADALLPVSVCLLLLSPHRFRLLEVDTSATNSDIKKAYRKLAMKW